jgi:acyl carrier protein
MSEYKNQVLGVLAEKSGVEPADITDESYFEDDLNISLLELAEILGDIEEMLEIEGLLEKKNDLETVGELLDLVADKVD